MKKDLFSILLKSNECVDRLSFEEFQKMMTNKKSLITFDLLHQAQIHDWPILAVLAAMTKQYRWKFCWIVWLSLSSDFNWNEKFKSVEELAKEVISHCIQKGFIQTLDISLSIFYPQSSMKIFSNFLWMSKKGTNTNRETIGDTLEQRLKQFIVKLDQDDYNLVAVKGKDESMNFIIRCLIKHEELNFQSSLQQERYLDALCRSEISQFSEKLGIPFLKRMRKILERTNMRVNFEELFGNDTTRSKPTTDAVRKVCESLINDHQFEAAIEIANLLKLPQKDFVFKFWIHMWNCEDKNSKHFEAMKYMKLVKEYDLSMDILLKFIKTVIKDLEPSVKKYNMMKFLLRNSWSENATELDQLEYDTILLYIKLKVETNAPDIELKPLMSEYYESVILKDKSIIHNSLYELKSIAKVDELTISHKTLNDPKEIEELDMLINDHLDAGDLIQVLRIQEIFGRAPENLKLLVYMMSIAENINSIYDIAKEERKMISSLGVMSNKFNRLTLRSIRTSSSSKSNVIFN